ncbi:MAG: hypothetical protein ACK4SF_13835 [Algoriphagus aquaeductus]|uniref:hypothetical protein n=1 Tax=Algoriphagus aquaeductus TaxID=475299 RepID=UPI00391ABFB5
MKYQDYLDQIEHLTVEQIVEGISNSIITFDDLKKTGDFDNSKQKAVRTILKEKENILYDKAKSLEELESYLILYPNGIYTNQIKEKIRIIKEEEIKRIKEEKEKEKFLKEIKEDINEYVPDEIISKLSREDLDRLCEEIGISPSAVHNYSQPILKFNEIPRNISDVPNGYTDIFFWGIPSSGKTCALAAIFNTIKNKYTMEAPDSEKKFGVAYRDSLINIFQNEIGNLPGRTSPDRTQYMPFLLSKRGEKNNRKVSFFELSGEVFWYFYELANNSQILDEYKREMNEKTFDTLNLLLNSENQKIHFFFIDYNQETKHSTDNNGLTQSNYLESAATYFRDQNNIFKKKTDAVYVIITKSDAIKGENKIDIANSFLKENFGSFMDVLKNHCHKNSVSFKVKLFSIGDVYFQRICKINRSYSEEIINELITQVKPTKTSLIRKFFNS